MVAVLGWVLASDFGDLVLAETLGLRFGVAVVLGVGGLLAAAMSWSSLAGTSGREGLAAFGATLPVRHLPMGGLGQAFGLAGAARVSGVASGTLMRAAPLFMATTAGGASLVAIPVLWDADAPIWVRLVVATGVIVTSLLVWRGAIVVEFFLRRWAAPLAIERTALVKAVLWSALAALGAAVAFALLFPFAPGVVASISGWSAAWLCGFVFVIAPAGLGPREAAMVALWPEPAASTVVAAALTHRLSTLAAEAVLFLISWRLTRSWAATVEEGG